MACAATSNIRDNVTTASVRNDERASRSVTSQQDTSASTQPAVTAFVKSQERTPAPGTTTNHRSALTSIHLPSTDDQNADKLHQSVVVTAGNSFSFHGSSPVETGFTWSYCPLGSRELMTIYNGNKFSNNFHLATKATVSNSDVKNCIFHVHALAPNDAGILACIDLPVNKYWSITILGKYW